MKYKGKIGEFKWWGFVLSLLLCVSVGFLAYSRFVFVNGPTQDQIKATADDALTRVNDLQAQVANLKEQVSALQKQVLSIDKGHGLH